MNPYLLLSMAAGILVGVGTAVVVAAFTAGPPRLANALAALDERSAVHRSVPDTGGRSRAARALLDLLRRSPATVPDADLDLLGWTRDRYLLGRAAAAAAYAAAGPALAVMLVVLDTGLSLLCRPGSA